MKHAWVAEALAARGYKQRDLATAWEVSEGAISRWMSGQERQDLPLSRARSLSRMLGMDLEELATRLGFGGDSPIPPAILPSPSASSIPVGTMLPMPMGGGRVRMLLHLDVPAEVAGRLLQIIGEAA